MIDKAILLCTRDIESMWRNGIPLSKAIRHMQYLINPQEVKQAKADLKAQYDRGLRRKRIYIKGV